MKQIDSINRNNRKQTAPINRNNHEIDRFN